MSLICELVKKVVDAAATGNTHCCFLLTSKTKATAWIQITWDMVNMGYPFSKDPVQKLASLGITQLDDAELVGWEARKFVTFEHGGGDPESITRFKIGRASCRER